MRASLVALVLTVSSLTTVPALACWDGSLATVGKVTYVTFNTDWSAREALEQAQWLTRIDRLLPDNATLEVWPNAVLHIDDESIELRWSGGLAKLYDAVARELKVNAASRALYRRLPVSLWTVQAGAFGNLSLAEARAETIGAQCPSGFLEVGGFPAENSAAHIEATVNGGYRVIVGTFLSRQDASEAMSCLAGLEDVNGSVTPVDGFVRRLDLPSFVAFAPPETPAPTL